jgi:hypothetical protein
MMMKLESGSWFSKHNEDTSEETRLDFPTPVNPKMPKCVVSKLS